MFYPPSGPAVTEVFLSGTDLPEGYRGNNGHYSFTEDHSFEDLITTYEYNFYKIDTAGIYNYLRQLPPFRQFKMSGTFHKISKDTRNAGNTEEYTETSTL